MGLLLFYYLFIFRHTNAFYNELFLYHIKIFATIKTGAVEDIKSKMSWVRYFYKSFNISYTKEKV